jgi:AcrR family transcriptional regulator
MKETILQKANEMYMTLGYKSVTMDDIAAELGISKKTIYQHYSNKNELVEASTLYLFERISKGVDEICGLQQNAIDEIFVIRNFLRKNLNNEATSPFYQLQKFFPKTFDCLRSRQFEKMHGSMLCMLENISKGIKEGLYRPDIDIDFISRIYFTGLTGIKDSDIFPTHKYEINAVTKQYIEYHLRAISTEKGLIALKIAIDKY